MEPSHDVVGTYRLQTGNVASASLGYYSAREFDFSPFEPARSCLVELGRACVHRRHRSLAVLALLWRGIADYAQERGGRYLIGCSSLTSQNPEEGAAMYSRLARDFLAEPEWQTSPHQAWKCPLERLAATAPPIPKLLSAYLSIGARICGEPALDREFRTIDFLTFLDLRRLALDGSPAV